VASGSERTVGPEHDSSPLALVEKLSRSAYGLNCTLVRGIDMARRATTRRASTTGYANEDGTQAGAGVRRFS